MLTIRASRLRALAASVDGWARSVAPVVIRDAASAIAAMTRFKAGVRHQYVMSQDSRHSFAPPRDSRGRRLRASVHGTGMRQTGGGSGFGRRKPTGPHDWLPGVAKVVLVFMVAGGAFLGSSNLYINFAADLPDANMIAANPVPEDSFIYASDGTTLLADVHREGVQHYYEPLSAMGKWLPEATISVEDANFYHEVGIDPSAMVRAALVDWRSHKATQGASTITQQLVKLRLLDSRATLDRKVKEAVLALQVERTYSKRQILEMYLNTVFYGNNSQGSAAASWIYFRKPTKDLDLAQAAMLAGIPQSPLYNAPWNNWEAAKARQKNVLDAMVRDHKITRQEADAAFAEDLNPANGKMGRPSPQIQAAPGFTSWIVDQLKVKYGTAVVEGGGLRVTTTLNMKLQKIAEQVMADQLNAERWRGATQGAQVSIDPHTGGVLTMVGAADTTAHGGQYNFATWPPRNPGSSFKVFNYTAGIASGKWTMVTPVNDNPIRIMQPDGKYWQPANYGNRYFGTVPFQQAMGNSMNIQAVKVELSTGVDKVAQTARDMGAPPWVPQANGTFTNNDPLSVFGPSLTLGGYGETPLQMATGVSVLAAQGVLHPNYGIARITTSDGSEMFKYDPAAQAKQVIDPKVAYIMETIMSDDDNRAMVFGRNSPLTLSGRKVAAKTGTTDDFKDAWTVGYTPDLATAVWYGDDLWHPMVDGSDGVFVAAPAWHNYMQQALDAMQKGNVWFDEPAGLQHFNVGGKVAYFLPGTSPNTPAPPLPPGVQQMSAPAPPPSSTPPGGGGSGHDGSNKN